MKKTMIYPARFEEKIGFDRIREMLAERCLSLAGRERVAAMAFSSDLAFLEQELERTGEMHSICLLEQAFPETGYTDTLPFLKQLQAHPMYCPRVEELVKLQSALATIRALLHFFEKTDEEAYPALKELCRPLTFFPAITQRLDALLDKTGAIRDNASATLAQIRRSLQKKEQQVGRLMAEILQQTQEQGFAESDAQVSVRDGRLLIPVPAAYKRQVLGYIYDQSATGKTIFIEPAPVVNLNNEIRELGFEEQREITKILQEFAAFLQPYVPDVMEQAQFLATIDFLRAKARLAVSMQAGKPVINKEPGIFLQRARHPLLEKALQREGKEIVPLTLKLDGVKRILLISGPNAGGKSVCLKTVGLLQYMFQCGLLIPASETSQLCLFEGIFLDIGDEQSLDNDLSTYSSHLLSMREILLHANDRSLVLIDEFGTGTEPTAGGAIAEALLEQWEEKGSFGVITTHYSNLKFYATTGKGVLNGAMQFDVQQMQPLFKLETGVPGNSFAFELARKMGLPAPIIQQAQDKAGAGFVETERYIRQIARSRRRWEEKVVHITQTGKKLDHITDKYQTELSEIRALRNQILKEARTEARQILQETNRKIELTIKEIRESQAEKEKTKAGRGTLQAYKEQMADDWQDEGDKKIAQKMEQLRKRQEAREKRKQKAAPSKAAKPRKPQELPAGPLQPGDLVRTKDGLITGEVMAIKDAKVRIAMGQMVTETDADRLERISAGEYKKVVRKGVVKTSFGQEALSKERLQFSPHLDVRGLRAGEALDKVARFLDDALVLGVNQVEILHGTGTGALRMEIRNYLQRAYGVASFEDEHVERGGPGITLVYLE